MEFGGGDQLPIVPVQATRELVDGLLRLSPVAMVVSRLADGKIVAANPLFLALHGYTEPEVLGRTSVELGLWVDEELRQRVFAALRAAPQSLDFESKGRCKNGELIDLSVSARVIDFGDDLCMVAFLIDRTTQRAAERALHESEGRYRAVVEDQTEIICRLKVDGTLIFVNEVYCRFFCVSADQLIGSTWQPLAYAEDIPLIEAKLAALAPDNPVVVIENRVYSGKGELHWMQFVNRGFFDESGRLLEIQAVGRDVTQRRQAEDALRATQVELERRVAERTTQLRKMEIECSLAEQKERHAIARDLHDDLGQLLHVAKIKIDLLAASPAPAAAGLLLREVDQLIGTASSRVRSLTSQLSPPVLSTLGLIPALAWLAEEMDRSYGLAVEFEDDGRPKQLGATASGILFRAVRELLFNVLKHARAPFARVYTASEDDSLVIVVEDEGIGMADVPATLSYATGFGLVSVKERIEHMGGRMDVASRLGDGTAVTLRVPYDSLDSKMREVPW